MPVKEKYVTIKNRIKTSIAVFAESNNKSEAEVQALICDKLGINMKQLGWWMNNSSQPSVEEAHNIAVFLKKSLSDIIYEPKP